MNLYITKDELLEKYRGIKMNELYNLNILFEANPNILNLDFFQIDNYIKERTNNGEKLKDIIDKLASEPYLFEEM